MPFDNDTPKPTPLKKLPKRYGWHRRYNDDDLNPRWRLYAVRSSAKLTEVLCIKNHLYDCAAKTRKHGSIGSFDIHECAVALDIAPETVASVFRVLVDARWLDNTGDVIQDWLDQQPEVEDPTAALRQKKKRRLTLAHNRANAGFPTAEDLEVLSTEEREAAAKFASSSRVTSVPAAPPKVEIIRPFVPIKPKENSYGALEVAHQENVRAARVWLLGDGVSLFSQASAIVAENYFGCNRSTAQAAITDWLESIDGDTVILATIISAAEQQALTGDAFRKVVEQRIAEVIRERTNGPALPFGIAAQNGGRRP